MFIDPTPATSSSTDVIPYMPAPGPHSALPPWLWQVFGAFFSLYILATIIGFAFPKTRLGAACRRWAANITDTLVSLRTGQKSDTATKDAQKAEDDAKKAEAEKKPEDPA